MSAIMMPVARCWAPHCEEWVLDDELEDHLLEHVRHDTYVEADGWLCEQCEKVYPDTDRMSAGTCCEPHGVHWDGNEALEEVS